VSGGGPPVHQRELDGVSEGACRARPAEAAGEHRTTIRSDPPLEELAHARDARDALVCKGIELGRRAAHRERHERPGARQQPARKGGVERVGDDVEIGQLGHGWRLYRRRPAC
jgi:hypothetical protein